MEQHQFVTDILDSFIFSAKESLGAGFKELAKMNLIAGQGALSEFDIYGYITEENYDRYYEVFDNMLNEVY